MAVPPHARPAQALALAATLLVAACGRGEGEAGRFARMADAVANTPLDASGAARPVEAPRPQAQPLAQPVQALKSAAESGLRPARMAVEVMDPHALWDARDAEAGHGPAPVPAFRADDARPAGDSLRPAVPVRPAPSGRTGGTTRVQLGAYASEAAARAAWSRLTQDRGAALGDARPVLERAVVDGRAVVRLKAEAPAGRAAALCAAVGVDDPWCRRAG